MKYINKVIELVKPRTTRSYKDGIELRGLDPEKAKEKISLAIRTKQWPVEIFDIDIQLKSISIRNKS